MKNKYEILEEVYHIAPESPIGIVIDWTYTHSTRTITYLVAFGYDQELLCHEYELCKSKRYAS